MSKKSLLKSNPYLKDPTKYREALITSVSSSTAIETGEPIRQIEAKLNLSRSSAKRIKLA